MKVRKPVFVLFMLVCVVCSLLPVRSFGSACEYVSHDYFTDYDSYLSYVSKENLTPHNDNFLSFDHFRVLGDFQSAYFVLNQVRYYEYGFLDENQFELLLLIQYGARGFPARQKYIFFPGKMEDMTRLGTKKSGTLVRGPMEYVYEDGLLTYIIWSTGTKQFTLYGTSEAFELGDYPLSGNSTITQRLLSKDRRVALAAFEELTANVPWKTEPRWDFYGNILYRSLLFIAAFSAVIMLLTKKYRIKRMVRQYIAASGNA